MSKNITEGSLPLTLQVDEGVLADFIQGYDLRPTPRSPLTPLIEKFSASSKDVAEPDGLMELLPPVVSPDIVLGLIHTPPERPEVAWFYGHFSDNRLTAHRHNEKGEHLFVGPFTDETLTSVLAAAVDLDAPAMGLDLWVELGRSGFEAFAAVVDLLQEEALEAALNRVLPKPFEFDLTDVVRCYARNLDTYDLRWLVQRAEILAPAPLQPFEESLIRGLVELEEQGLLSHTGEWYLPTEKMIQLAELIGPVSGFCGVATLRREGGNWRREHLAVQRGIGTLWLMEFGDITLDSFRVRIGDVVGELLHERLRVAVSIG